VNEGGYWTPMLEMMDKIVDGGFMGQNTIELLQIVDTVPEAFELLEETFK
jgi:predicted Rossmann-fold nucleotide-binding protein